MCELLGSETYGLHAMIMSFNVRTLVGNYDVGLLLIRGASPKLNRLDMSRATRFIASNYKLCHAHSSTKWSTWRIGRLRSEGFSCCLYIAVDTVQSSGHAP